MFVAFMELICWVVLSVILLENKSIDANAWYIAWTIVISVIAMVFIYKDKED